MSDKEMNLKGCRIEAHRMGILPLNSKLAGKTIYVPFIDLKLFSLEDKTLEVKRVMFSCKEEVKLFSEEFCRFYEKVEDESGVLTKNDVNALLPILELETKNKH